MFKLVVKKKHLRPSLPFTIPAAADLVHTNEGVFWLLTHI